MNFLGLNSDSQNTNRASKLRKPRHVLESYSLITEYVNRWQGDVANMAYTSALVHQKSGDMRVHNLYYIHKMKHVLNKQSCLADPIFFKKFLAQQRLGTVEGGLFDRWSPPCCWYDNCTLDSSMKGFSPSLALEEWTEITAKDRLSQQKKIFERRERKETKMTVCECSCLETCRFRFHDGIENCMSA